MNSDDKVRRTEFFASDRQTHWKQESLLGYWQGHDVDEDGIKPDSDHDTSGNDTLTGTDGNDILDGGRGDDTIDGGDGDDYLIGGRGRDVINGGEGNDHIADGWGTGSMDGGAGVDTLDVSHTKTGSNIDLVAGTVDWDDNHSPTETAINFENVIGSNGDNSIIGTDEANILEGRAGNDTFDAGEGNDTLYGGSGQSRYIYNLGDGSDTIYNGVDQSGATSTADIGMSTAQGDHEPSRSSQSSRKSDAQDTIAFGEGITEADVDVALSGDDLILSLSDGEVITLEDFANNPVETLAYADGSIQDISSLQSQDWTGRRATWFSSGRDNHTGGEGNDRLDGRSGHDVLNGAGGDDILLGGSGNDKLFGGAGDDVLNGGKGEDTIFGDAGDDTISGGYGIDHLDGGAGIDTLDYAYSTEDVDIDLSEGLSTFGSGNSEITTNFENVIGSQGNNIITGTDGANTIDGGDGNDVIRGGAGKDRLKGGEGADIFAFSKGDGIDIIDDFDPNTDTLRISGAGNDSIIIQYMAIGTLITYGRDENGNPTDQVFLTGVESGLVTKDDIEQPDAAFIGTDEADIYDGTDEDETISSFAGDDEINAAGGNDYIEAGEGADLINAGDGNDYVEGGLGTDTVWLGEGNDTFVDDAETGATGSDEVHGGGGEDRFYGSGGDDIFYGDAGSDILNGGAGNDTLVGDDGTATGKLFASYFRLTSDVKSVNNIPQDGLADGRALVGDLDVGALALDKGGNDDHYGVRYVGVINVDTTGTYTFESGSDDGSQLWIDGILVVNNDGLHSMEYQSGSIELAPGIHQFELTFFENTGDNQLELTVQGPDMGGAVFDIFASGILGDAALSEKAPTGFGLEDVLNGGAGDDVLTGGSGADMIELDFGDGIDTMTDFEDGLDIIDLSATGLAFADLTITDSAEGVHITYEMDAGDNAIGELILTDVLAADISDEDFQFG